MQDKSQIPNPQQGAVRFIELNRRFRKMNRRANSEEGALESYTRHLSWQGDDLGWDDILKENRAVILGEPGSGKSWELQERAKILLSEAKFAFYIRLDQLVERDLVDLLDSEEQNRLVRWKNGQDIAFFFLDSVDEAKFRKISDFHGTLKRFRNDIGFDSLGRARIFLSSRISEWKPNIDQFEFQELFPSPPSTIAKVDGSTKTQTQANELLVLGLEPLNRKQVECFASQKGVTSVEDFTAALDKAFAWEFARRPLDVTDLINFWKEEGRIGSLSELIEFDVVSKLRARSDRSEFPLSDAKSHEGAEWLGASTFLCRKFSFFISEDGSMELGSLAPIECLPPNFSTDDARALMNRAIFDSPIYGRLRFHHRRVGEYLAAKWISTRMQEGCSIQDLEHILVGKVRGSKILRPSMRPVAAWLCLGNESWNAFVRNLIAETDPRVHLKYGDPAGLSIEYRKQILIALAGLAKDRK